MTPSQLIEHYRAEAKRQQIQYLMKKYDVCETLAECIETDLSAHRALIAKSWGYTRKKHIDSLRRFKNTLESLIKEAV